MILSMILEKTEGIIGERVRKIEVLAGPPRRLLIECQTLRGVRFEEIAGPADDPVVPVKPPAQRPGVRVVGSDMPFSGHAGPIPRLFQDFGDGHTSIVQPSLVGARRAILLTPVLMGHPTDPGLVGMKPRQEAGPGRAAAGGIVELAEAEALLGQAVEGRRTDFVAVAADVREAHVVGHDQEDVGLFPGTLEQARVGAHRQSEGACLQECSSIHGG